MKKPVLLTFLLSLVCIMGLAQNKHSVGFMVRPAWSDVANRLTTTDDFSGGFAISTGILYDYQASRRVALSGGVSFSTLSENYQTKTLRWGSEHDGNGGWAGPDPSLPNDLEVEHTYYFLDLSLGARYYLNQGRFRLFAFPYTEGNVYLSGKTDTKLAYDDGQTSVDNLQQQTNPNVRGINLSAGVGVGVEVALGQSIHLVLMPSYEQMLLSMGKRVDVDEAPRFYNAGVALGVMYRP